MTCSQCEGIEREFDSKMARKELRRYRRKGVRKATRLLLDALLQDSPEGKTLLDIGGGVGMIPFELLAAGVTRATAVDASSAYLQTASEEAAVRDLSSRVSYIHGNFIEVAPKVEVADVVTLDRVICCYPDMDALVDASASKALRHYGLVYPRDTSWMRIVPACINQIMRLRRSPMRFFLHPTGRVDAAVRRHGFVLQSRRMTPMWQMVLYRRSVHQHEVPV